MNINDNELKKAIDNFVDDNHLEISDKGLQIIELMEKFMNTETFAMKITESEFWSLYKNLNSAEKQINKQVYFFCKTGNLKYLK